MKSTRKLIFLLSFFFGSALFSRAQGLAENKVYRITAYKLGNTAITSTSNYAEITPPLHLYIPSAFTPNGDGLNDSFGIKGEGISYFHIFVYDRWGKVIFESTNPLQTWDGKVDGTLAATGVYTYQVFATGTGSKGRTGAVTLLY